VLLPDLVADRGNRLEVLRDREQVGLVEILVAGQRAVDDLGHQPARHVAVWLVAAAQIVGDLLDRPLADPRFPVRRDVRHGFVVLKKATIARKSSSAIPLKTGNGCTGSSRSPLGRRPSRIAVMICSSVQPPIPVCRSGLMLLEYTLPNAPSYLRPPALG